jgi:hypothetical protein
VSIETMERNTLKVGLPVERFGKYLSAVNFELFTVVYNKYIRVCLWVVLFTFC